MVVRIHQNLRYKHIDVKTTILILDPCPTKSYSRIRHKKRSFWGQTSSLERLLALTHGIYAIVLTLLFWTSKFLRRPPPFIALESICLAFVNIHAALGIWMLVPMWAALKLLVRG